MYYKLHTHTSTACYPFCNYKAELLPFCCPFCCPSKFCRQFCYHLIFNNMTYFLPHPPTPYSGNKRQETAKNGNILPLKVVSSKYYTPNPCFVCNCVQKYAFTVQKCAMGYKEGKKYAFTVQKCVMDLFFNRAERQIYTPTPCFVCNCVQKLPFTVQRCAMGYKEWKKYAFTVQKCAMGYKEKKKYAFTVQKCATGYREWKEICVQCAKVCNGVQGVERNMRSLCKSVQCVSSSTGQKARITRQTPVLCVIVCKNYRSLCKSVQWGTGSGKKYAFSVQKCAMGYKEKKKLCVHCAKVCNGV
jgi:hypothetical protein